MLSVTKQIVVTFLTQSINQFSVHWHLSTAAVIPSKLVMINPTSAAYRQEFVSAAQLWRQPQIREGTESMKQERQEQRSEAADNTSELKGTTDDN